MRESKVEGMKNKTFKFYNYDTQKTIEFSKFKVLSTQPLVDKDTEIEKNDYKFDLVIITLPTNVLYGENGKTMVQELTKCGSAETNYLVISPGYTLYEDLFKVVGIKKDMVVFGLPLFLSHEVEKTEFNDKKFKDLESCDVAFHMLLNSYRILILSKKPKTLKKALKESKKGAISLGIKTLELSTAMFLILNLLLKFQDYPKSLKKDESFKAAMKAWAQITRHYGFIGFWFRLSCGKNVFKLSDYFNRRQSKPLTVEFLRYHHGDKVKQQNIEVLSKYITSGKAKDIKVDKIQAFINMF